MKGAKMAWKEEIKEWPWWCAALALFVACAGLCWFFFWNKPGEVARYVMIGDSIYAEKRGGASVADGLSKTLGEPAFNGALGGTSLARSEQLRHADEKTDLLSGVALSKAMVSKDYGVQKQIHVVSPATEYFDDVILQLSKMDLSKTEMLIIGYGMNDYQNGVPLDDPEDPLNEYTFGGALRATLKSLKHSFPKLRILLLTPTYSWYVDREETCEELDWGGGYLEKYAELEKRIGEEYGVETLDLYHDFYPHETFEDWSKFTRDGVHPNEKGIELITQRISSYLEDHPR